MDLADLRQFTGTDQWFRHILVRNVLYTEGVQYLAEKANCYWLIDKIATNQMLPELRKEEFQVWKLRVANDKGTLSAEDGNDHQVYCEQLDYTDFPMPEVDLWFTNNTILLPSEY